MSGIIGGTAQNLNVRNNVYDADPGVLAWVPMTQPLVVTDTLNVDADITDEPTRDLGKVDIASLYQYTPVGGRLPVDGSGVTQPVSGTFWQATQPVSGSVSVSNLGELYNFIQSAEDVTYKYYGYLSSAGWKFKRKTLATSVWMVATGTGDYDTAWVDRVNKSYGYI
jgi:hypothetical protein